MNKNFPKNMEAAIKNGFAKAEKVFFDSINGSNDQSGSCAIAVIIIGSKCYIANTGDSRAILSSNKGHNVIQLSKDHKPNTPTEKTRIISNGGKIYCQHNTIFRVLPGRLSVSRTFGDAHAKLVKHGGKEGVVIADPDVIKLNIEPNHDFIIIGSDGLFDKLTNEEIIKTAWKTKEESKAITPHKSAGKMIDAILEAAVSNKSLDNITAVMICFEGFIDNGEGSPRIKTNVYRLINTIGNKKKKSIYGKSINKEKIDVKIVDK